MAKHHQSLARIYLLTVAAFFFILTVCNGWRANDFSNDVQFQSLYDSLHNLTYTQPAAVFAIADSLLYIYQGDPLYRADLIHLKGLAETSLGNMDNGLLHYVEAYNIYDSLKNERKQVSVLINLGINRSNSGDLETGRDYLMDALVKARSDRFQLAAVYTNLGAVYEQLGKPEEALIYYWQAVPLLEADSAFNRLAVIYHNIAVVYGVQEDYTKSREFEMRALEFYEKEPSPETYTMITLTLGSLYLQMDSILQAETFLVKGGAVAEELKLPYYLKAYYYSMAELNKVKNNLAEVVKWQEKYMERIREDYASEKLALGMELERKFRNNLKNKEIELLKVEAALKENIIRQNNVWKVLLIVGIILSAVLGGVIYRNYKLKAHANALLEKNQKNLERENAALQNENALVQYNLLRNQISPHFLFNSLNALTSLIRQDPEQAVRFTQTFSGVFRNTLHLKDQTLISLEEEVSHVKAYLHLQEMRFGNNLKTSFDLDLNSLDKLIPPFSLQLIIENAIKHNIISNTLPLWISIRATHDQLIVENNYQPRKGVEPSTGTGIVNIKNRYVYHTDSHPVFEQRGDKWYVGLPLIDRS